MNEAPENSLGLAEPKPPGESWSLKRWIAVIAFVFAAHVALVFLFGEKKPVTPRAVANVPLLRLANNTTDELLALNDPTLFALPNARDFASAVWLKAPAVHPPSFRWTEPPRWLLFSVVDLGATFNRLMQTNLLASYPLNFKPTLTVSTPVLPIEPLLPQTSSMRMEGELAQRQLPVQISLTNWPYADVLPPSVVQVLVNAAGSVVSTVILTSSGYDAADQHALVVARSLRFKPSVYLTIGRVIFNWHTVPPATAP